jgi:hypothetical protein
MAAEPAEHYEDPLDPQRILRELPGRERANFLAAYREALDGARDPAGWGNLRRVLRLWSGMVIATNRPGFYEAQEAALAGTGGGMLLEDYVRCAVPRRELPALSGVRRPECDISVRLPVEDRNSASRKITCRSVRKIENLF